jgi:hyperosmotically inducible periplasmic protein
MNRTTRSIALAGIVGSLALVACGNSDAPRPGTDAATTADRSAPGGNATTAMDQSNSSEHLDITARIRRAVMDDDALSTGAKNATIVTDATGTVTLRGNVQSQAEKDAIAAKATAVVGPGRVVNQLVVNP